MSLDLGGLGDDVEALYADANGAVEDEAHRAVLQEIVDGHRGLNPGEAAGGDDIGRSPSGRYSISG